MLKNITLSAEEEYIEKARAVAASENRTLNQVFREWLEQYQARGNASEEYKKLMQNLSGVKSGKAKFSREDLNRR